MEYVVYDVKGAAFSFSGLLHRAQWHHSPAGVAAAAAKPAGKKAVHLPESPHHLAWFRTWSELRQGQCPAMRELIEIYLSSLSGTGTIDRWFGALRKLENYRPSLSPRGAEASLKLVVQDHGGRRREPLDAKKMLIHPTAKRTVGEAIVVYPATDFALRAARLYSEFFGVRKAEARSMEPNTGPQIAKKRLLAEKPRLSAKRPRGNNSEIAQLGEYQDSVQEVVQKVCAGQQPTGEGPLGLVDLPGACPSNLFGDMAKAVADVRSKRKCQPSKEPETFAPEGEEDDLSKAELALVKQAKVLQKKEEMAANAKPNMPVPYVDANAGIFRAPRKAPVDKTKAPALPSEPTVLVVGQDGPFKLPKPYVLAKQDRVPHIVCVKSLTAGWSSPPALLARLGGCKLADRAWVLLGKGQHVDFKPFAKLISFTWHLSPGFVSEHSDYVQPLQVATAWSSQAVGDKGLRVIKHDPSSMRKQYPKSKKGDTWVLGASERDPVLPADAGDWKPQTLRLPELLQIATRCYD